MRVFACALAISLAATAPAEAAPPGRVASIKLCTDELLLLLAKPEQIASVTYLSQQKLESPLWRQAARYHANDGTLIDVAGLAPDLILDMGGGGRDTARISGRIGARLLTLPYPQNLDDIEDAVRRVAAALHRPEAGARVVQRIQALRRSAPRHSIDAVWLGGGGRSLAPTGLGAEWMRIAGLRQRALAGDRLTLEQLLVAPPALLVRSDYRTAQYSAEQSWLSHPLVARSRRARTISTDGRRWTCMGPLLITESLRLRSRVTR